LIEGASAASIGALSNVVLAQAGTQVLPAPW
jgi:hypothetical protein